MRTPGFRLWIFSLGILLLGGAVGCAASETDNVMQTTTGGASTGLGTGGRASVTGGAGNGGGRSSTGTSTCLNGATCVGPGQCITASGTTCRCSNGKYSGC